MSDEERTRRLVALAHEPQGVPRLVAKASGEAAEEILRRRAAGGAAAPVVRNEALLEQLFRLPLDAPIGAELFKVVALLLAHVLAVEAALAERPDA